MRHPALWLWSLGLLALGCGDPAAVGDGLDDGNVNLSSEEIRSTGSPPWMYTGPLPALANVQIYVSQAGHTARVVGDLPADWNGTVPYYAVVERVGTTRKLTVVYPIATGASASHDSQPGRFTSVTTIPYRPNGMAYPSTGPTYVTWGGFPFIGYNNGIAFHGPITFSSSTAGGEQVYEWYLRRGPVSHGCNRMQGEHVVELAHLLGYDMRNTWQPNQRVTRRVTINVSRDYDRLPSGETVDVDYPRTAGAVAPSGPVRMFRTWNADEMPRIVCADSRARRVFNTTVGTDFCDAMPANTRDLATGAPTGPVVVDNGTSGFTATASFATYTRSPVRVGADYTATTMGTAGTATWRLPVTTEGSFRVWARYAPDENRNTRAGYRVFPDSSDALNAAPITVNQRLPGQQGWVELGTFTLRAGAHVTLTVDASADGYTIADAVRIEPTR